MTRLITGGASFVGSHFARLAHDCGHRVLILDAGLGLRRPLTLYLDSSNGASVREVLAAAQRVRGHEVPHTMGPRRAGDPPALVADPALALRVLGWRAERSELATMVEDALRSRLDADPRRMSSACRS